MKPLIHPERNCVLSEEVFSRFSCETDDFSTFSPAKGRRSECESLQCVCLCVCAPYYMMTFSCLEIQSWHGPEKITYPPPLYMFMCTLILSHLIVSSPSLLLFSLVCINVSGVGSWLSAQVTAREMMKSPGKK